MNAVTGFVEKDKYAHASIELIESRVWIGLKLFPNLGFREFNQMPRIAHGFQARLQLLFGFDQAAGM